MARILELPAGDLLDEGSLGRLHHPMEAKVIFFRVDVWWEGAHGPCHEYERWAAFQSEHAHDEYGWPPEDAGIKDPDDCAWAITFHCVKFEDLPEKIRAWVPLHPCPNGIIPEGPSPERRSRVRYRRLWQCSAHRGSTVRVAMNASTLPSQRHRGSQSRGWGLAGMSRETTWASHLVVDALDARIKALEDFRNTQGPVGSEWEARIEGQIKALELGASETLRQAQTGARQAVEAMGEELRADISNAFDALAAEAQVASNPASNPLAALEQVKAALKAAGFTGTLTLTIE